MRIVGLLLMAVAGAGLTSPAFALTLSCHLGNDNVVISLNPDEEGGVAAIEHMKTWQGVAAISEGAYRIWLDEGYDPADVSGSEEPGVPTVRMLTPKELAEFGRQPVCGEVPAGRNCRAPGNFAPDLYLEIDRYTGRANAQWGDGQKFFGKSQNCRIVDKQLF